MGIKYRILCNMPLLPRICTFGIGLHRVSFHFSHPLAHSTLRLLPASSSSRRLPAIPQYRSVSTDEKIKQLEEKCRSDPAHFKKTAPSQAKTEYEDYTMAHPIWSAEETNEVEITHQKPSKVSDWAAYITVQMMRKGFDLFSGYTIKSWLKTLDERYVAPMHLPGDRGRCARVRRRHDPTSPIVAQNAAG